MKLALAILCLLSITAIVAFEIWAFFAHPEWTGRQLFWKVWPAYALALGSTFFFKAFRK